MLVCVINNNNINTILELITTAWYGGVSFQDSILASMLLRPGPTRPFHGRIDGGEDDGSSRSGNNVPRVYIKTMQDRVLKPEQQDAMIRRWPPSQVFVLDSDHSPFFSAPFDLFTSILKASESIKYH